MHFGLRTLFVIVTTVAVYTAFNVAIIQWTTTGMGAPHGLNAALRLPLLIVWVVGALWIFERRVALAGTAPLLVAFIVNAVWTFVGPAMSLYGIYTVGTGRPLGSTLLALSSLVSVPLQTATWILVLIAFAQANNARRSYSVAAQAALPDDRNPWNTDPLE